MVLVKKLEDFEFERNLKRIGKILPKSSAIDFEKSRVYTRIDAETELKTLVADTGNLDIWITDFENGRGFLEVGPDIAGIISIVLYSIAYEAE